MLPQEVRKARSLDGDATDTATEGNQDQHKGDRLEERAPPLHIRHLPQAGAPVMTMRLQV